MRQPELARRKAVAAAGLALVLVVVMVSATIRLNASSQWPAPFLDGSQLRLLRILHRASASLEVLAALWLAWAGFRDRRARAQPWRAACAALLLTAFLSALGVLAGQTPSRVQALGNLLGGLALASAFAWLLGTLDLSSRRASAATALFLGGLLAAQALIGARLSVFGRTEMPALPAHAMLGLAIAALLGWWGLARLSGTAGKALFALALVAPLAGFTALHAEYSAAAALAHAAAAAGLVVGAAWALGRTA